MNINSDIDYFKNVNLDDFPIFLKNIKFDNFRHIPSLEIDFKNPISIISGTNRS